MQSPVNGAFAVLLTSDEYFVGVQVLHWSLRSVHSVYPLVVLYTRNTLSNMNVQKLRDSGCILKETHNIEFTDLDDQYAQPYYPDTWTKLRMFGLTEYSRVVLVDADMLVRQNVDDLMTLEIPDGWVAASPACVCNPMNIQSYPENWSPENCPYTYYSKEPVIAGEDGKPAKQGISYFNSGLIVFRPSVQVYEGLKSKLKSIQSLDQYRFPDMDFLNEVYAGKWIQLPYYYNALRPLVKAHASLWNDSEVRIAHYILTKPWHDTDWEQKSEEERRHDVFYTVNSWWFEAYNKSKDDN